MHAVAVAEESDVDVFGGDVAVDDSADDDLLVYYFDLWSLEDI